MKEKGKDWKRQTLNTLLFRLEEKGVIVRRRAYVWSVLSKEELLKFLVVSKLFSIAFLNLIEN